MMRATISNLKMHFTKYNLKSAPGHQREGLGVLASSIYGQDHQPVELPNIMKINWARSVDQDVASMRMTLWNCETLPIGTTPESGYEYDIPGYFTNRRGVEGNPWGHERNGWRARIAPDRIIRTFEGYGFDPEVIPEDDPNLYPSGVWIIDTVDYTADGYINIEARDLGRILMDQIAFPPVIPHHEYPVVWEPSHQVQNRETVRELAEWRRPTYDTDSNVPWIGKGFMDGDRPYVNDNGGVFGHYGRHAFDGQPSTYWLSVGNQPNWESAYEYVQGRVNSQDIYGVQIKAWGGPYRAYISVFADGEWKGQRKIPYQPRNTVDTGAGIRFLTSVHVGRNEELTLKLPKVISNATKVRVTLTDLFTTGVGELQYRGGIREVRVATNVEKVSNEGTHPVGNFNDYTDIVKWFCAWGGFYWPSEDSGNAYWTKSDGTKYYRNPNVDDPSLVEPNPGGRVWGDWMPTYTRAAVPLGVEIWDKKPLLDCIKYVKDIIGYNFWVDELGGIMWRQVNHWKQGNYLVPPEGGMSNDYVQEFITINEAQTLVNMSAKMDGANIRERVFVANVNGKTGAVVRGWNPRPSGLRRVAGWTDEHFETDRECHVMAKLIAARQRFTFRRNSLTIPGHPGIQLDDQVWIEERYASEWNNLHYVSGIASDWDITQGKWTYQLTTHWLGHDPEDEPGGAWWWHIDGAGDLLDDVTRAYLRDQGAL
jgi:hypothetical protein